VIVFVVVVLPAVMYPVAVIVFVVVTRILASAVMVFVAVVRILPTAVIVLVVVVTSGANRYAIWDFGAPLGTLRGTIFVSSRSPAAILTSTAAFPVVLSAVMVTVSDVSAPFFRKVKEYASVPAVPGSTWSQTYIFFALNADAARLYCSDSVAVSVSSAPVRCAYSVAVVLIASSVVEQVINSPAVSGRKTIPHLPAEDAGRAESAI
jgi:hypothetical protein